MEKNKPALIIANGFEECLSTVIQFLTDRYGIEKPAVLLISNRYYNEPHGISDLEDEVHRLQDGGPVYILRQKDLMRSIKSLCKHRPTLQTYQKVIFNCMGDKQLILLLILIFFFLLPLKATFLSLNLYDLKIKRLRLTGVISHIVKKLTSRKFINVLLTRGARWVRLAKIPGYPDNMVVESSSVCNLRCRVCATGRRELGRKQGFLDVKGFQRLMDEIGPYIRHLNLFFMGEPFLNPHILELVEVAKIAGVSVVEIDTNGNAILPPAEEIIGSGLDVLSFAIDGVDQGTYQFYRQGGDLNRVIDQFKAIVATRKRKQSLKPTLIIQFIVMRQNLHQLKLMEELSQSLGADHLRLKYLNPFMADISPKEARDLMPKSKQLTLVEITDKIVLRSSLRRYHFCPHLWDSAVVTWEGDVLPCCHDSQASVVLGNVFASRNFRDIWDGSGYIDLRRNIIAGKGKPKICRKCIYG